MPEPLLHPLFASAVDAVFRSVLFLPGEPTESAVMARGVRHTFGFHPGRLELAREKVVAWIAQLPPSFQPDSRGGGGGDSFLNACMTASGEQWGEHRNVEQLMALGLALELLWRSPPDLDFAMPGGVPGFRVRE